MLISMYVQYPWSNWTPNDSFGICSSWGFRNFPYMFNLMKFWLWYLRLKTMETISKIDCSATFYLPYGNWALSSTLNVSVNAASNLKIRVSFRILMTSIFQNWPWPKGWRQCLISEESVKSWRAVNFWNDIHCL